MRISWCGWGLSTTKADYELNEISKQVNSVTDFLATISQLNPIKQFDLDISMVILEQSSDITQFYRRVCYSLICENSGYYHVVLYKLEK